MRTVRKQSITNQKLVELFKEEIKKNGRGTWSQRRQTIEEMMRMRGLKIDDYV